MIECEGLTKRFGNFTAVDHVSFSVARGSIFGFLGPNGSGKSTVIRMLCGILEPTEGTARIAGRDIVAGDLRAAFRRFENAAEHSNDGRFARAVRPEESED